MDQLGNLPDSVFDDGEHYDLTIKHVFPVDLTFFSAGHVHGFDLFLERDGRFVLFCSGEYPLREEETAKLVRTGVRTLYILKTEREKYLQFLERSMLTKVVDPTIAVVERSRALYEMSRSVVSDLLANPESKRHLGRSKSVVEGIYTLLDRAPEALRSLFSQQRLDAYVVTHCINVCIFGIALGGKMGLKDAEEIKTLGLGCLLHDIGKQVIPARIVNKPGKLSPEEWMVMKRHPELGLRLAMKSGGVPEPAYIPIIQHHEKLDGTGYPKRLKGEEIHLWGRIAAVADIFDALTSDRPYQRAGEAFPALKLMKDEFDGKIDPDIFRELVLLLKA